VGEVRLEVRAAAFVDQLALWLADDGRDVRLHVSGLAVGSNSDHSLAIL
jgi:hypothetical protein